MANCHNSGNNCSHQIIFEFNMNTIVQSTVNVNCGSPVIIFTDTLGFELSIEFEIICNGPDCAVVCVCVDISCAMEYELQFIFFYSGMPSVYVTSDIFVVVVVNVCVPPPGCIDIPGCGIPDPTINPPAVDIEIEITVGIDISIDLPSWNCGTPGCDQ
jgi:hypothetical protein